MTLRKFSGAIVVLLLLSTSCGAKNVDVYMMARTASPSQLREAVEAGADFNVSRDIHGDDYDKYKDGEIIYGFGGTPLHDAASYNHDPESVKFLIGLGLDVNAEGQEGLGSSGTPLTCAVNEKNLPAVKVLLEAGADPHYWETVLFWQGTAFHNVAAWYRDDPDAARYVIGELVRAGGDVNIHDEFTDEEKYSVFEIAYHYNRSSAILKGGSFDTEGPFDLNALFSRMGILCVESSCTPLIFAVLYDNPVVVDILLDYGADAGIRNIEGRTALYYARYLPAKSRLKKSSAYKRLKEATIN